MFKLFIFLLVGTCSDNVKANRCEFETQQSYFNNLVVWKSFWKALPGNLQLAIDGNNKFAFDFLRVMSEVGSKTENMLFSPFSISTAFGLVKAGVDSETKIEMAKAFGWDKLLPNFEEATIGFFLHSIKLRSTKETYLKMANKIWIDIKASQYVEKEYYQKIRYYYDTNVEYSDFEFLKHPDEQDTESNVVTLINDFVQNETNGHIRNLMSDNMITIFTKLILVNAVYFKGTWEHQFDKKYTVPMPFFIDNQTVTMVHMMNKKDIFSYTHDNILKCHVVELVYACGKFSMLLILPDNRNGLQTLGSKINSDDIDRWLLEFNSTEMLIRVPKFKISSKIMLKPALRCLGIKKLFSAEADFSKMINDPFYNKLQVGEIPHSAFLEMNEEGAIGSAATGIKVESRSRRDLPELRFYSPFMFLIRHRETGSTIFVGNVYNPNKH